MSNPVPTTADAMHEGIMGIVRNSMTLPTIEIWDKIRARFPEATLDDISESLRILINRSKVNDPAPLLDGSCCLGGPHAA